MTEPSYSIKEILESNFRSLEAKISDLRQDIKDNSVQTDKQIARLDRDVIELRAEVNELKEDNARYKLVWGIGATVGASLMAFFLNRIF